MVFWNYVNILFLTKLSLIVYLYQYGLVISPSTQRIIIYYCHLFGCSSCPRFGQGESLQTALCILLTCSQYLFILSTFLLFRTRQSRLICTLWAPVLEPATYTKRLWHFFPNPCTEFSCWPRSFQLYFEKNKGKAKSKFKSDMLQCRDCKTQVWRENWVNRSIIESELVMQASSLMCGIRNW